MSIVGWLVLLLVAVGFADSPLLRAGLPLGDQTENQLTGLVELDHLLRQGVLYSRWQPDLVYGYGAPSFSFGGPLSTYLAEAGHRLGFSLRGGLTLELAALPILAGGASYAFLRRRLGAGPAVLGAVAYVASLCFLDNLYARGSVADALAMALFPVVLLVLDRLMAHPGPGRAALLAIVFGALLLSHASSGLALLPLLVLGGLWWAGGQRSSLGWGALGLALGIGVALFFLGPAVLGLGDAGIPASLAAPGAPSARHFLTLGQLLVPVAIAYPGAMLANLPPGLGLVQTLLGLAALLGLPRLPTRAQGEVVILLLSLIVGAALTLSVSKPVWAHVPLLPLIQDPGRLLAVADFAAALLVGYAAEGLLAPRSPAFQAAAAGLVAAALLLLAIPYLYPPPGDRLPANPTLAQVTGFQQRAAALGQFAGSEPWPRGLSNLPPGPPFAGADQGATLGQKLDPASLPTDATVQPLDDGQLATRLQIVSPTPFVARFFVFAFPGWTASLDGQSVPLGRSGPYQTLTVPVPAGSHVLAIQFGETRGQEAFDLLSLLSTLGVLGLLVGAATGRWTPRRRWTTGDPGAQRTTGRGLAGRAMAALLLVGLLGVGLKWAFFDQVSTPLVQRFDGTNPPGMAVADPHRFGASLELLGYSVAPAVGRPGGAVTCTLYWATAAPLPVSYGSFVHLLSTGAEVALVSQEANATIADFPTTLWRVGAYARDVHQIALPATLAPGTYRVEVGVSDQAHGGQLPVDGHTGPGGSVLSLTTLNVEQ